MIDSVSRACSVALYEDEQLLAGCYQDIGRGHAEHLIPMIDALPNQGKAARIAVNVGPGSFTGVRIGLSAARALALAWGSELAGYGALSLVNAMLRAQSHQLAPTAIIMQGGHGEYCAGLFDAEGAAQGLVLSFPPEQLQEHLSRPLIGGDAFDRGALMGHAGAVQLLPDARQFHLLTANHMVAAQAVYIRAPDAALPKVK